MPSPSNRAQFFEIIGSPLDCSIKVSILRAKVNSFKIVLTPF